PAASRAVGSSRASRVCMQSLIPEPKDSCRNDPHGAVALSPFVVAGCQGTELLAAGDEVLHPMAAAVELAVERPMSRLPLLVRDGIADATPTTVGAEPSTGVALIAPHAVPAQPG